MKKILTGFLTVTLLLSLGTVTVFAAGKGQKANCASAAVCSVQSTGNCSSNYADADNDGVCDNRLNNANGNFVDNDNDGICDNRLNNANSNFVDNDNDGVCDNRQNKSHGNGHHRNNGSSKCSH